MRKFIVIVVASLIPVGMWTAGCRQDNRQAAFPKTPEMKGLAKADAKSASTDAPPVIPAAPIDRDILNLPENATMARVNAVDDRSKQLVKPKTPEGLFTLPDKQDHFAMAAPAPSTAAEYQAAPAALQPIPSAREFWSRPVAPVERRPLDVPDDIAAMAAPTPVDAVMAPPAPYLAPIPSSPAALPVENVPGLFDGSPVSMQSGGPPAAPGRFDGLSPRGGALGAAPLSSREDANDADGPLRLDLAGLTGGGRDSDIAGPASFSPAIDPTIVVQSIPGDYEPLPEPIPLAEYNKMMAREQGIAPAPAAPATFAAATPVTPVAAAAPAAAQPPLPSLDAAPARPVGAGKDNNSMLAIDPAAIMAPLFPGRAGDAAPAAKAVKPVAPLPGPEDIKQALAPLPDISSRARAADKPARSISLPPPVMPAAMPGPDLTAAKTTLLPLEDKTRATAGGRDADFFKTDFWERRPASGKQAFDMEELPEPKTGRKDAAEEQARPSLKPPTGKKDMESARRPAEVLGGRKADSGETKSVPQKVKLRPIRRSGELGAIDSAAEAPPLRY